MKVLLSATVSQDGRVDATFERESLGAMKPARKESGWPQAVKDAGKALVKACDDASAEDPDVAEVQVYGGNDVVDVRFVGGSGERAEADSVPPALAKARDKFRAAINDALKA